MKKRVPLSIIGLAAALLFSLNLLAQEKTEITVHVKKDGKVVKDTTYQFDDATQAKHAMKMMEMLSGEEEHMMKHNYTMAHGDADHSKTMIFISEDGKTKEIKEFHGDSLVWISEGDQDEDHVKVMKYNVQTGDHPHGEHVVIMKSGDGETFDILLDDESDGEKMVKKKKVKVMVSSDDDGEWVIHEGDHDGHLKHVDEDVYIIKSDGDEVDIEKIIEEHSGENVKVIVIKKDGEGDEDEVEVIEKKEKKEKK